MIFHEDAPAFASCCASFRSCAPRRIRDPRGAPIIVSVPSNELAVIENGSGIAQFPISTSKFGLGDRPRSYATPLGLLGSRRKSAASAPVGAVFRGQRRTGEVLRPNAPGRDPIVTRILPSARLEARNARAFGRGIYIHGTPRSGTSAVPPATAASACDRAMSSASSIPCRSGHGLRSSIPVSAAPCQRSLRACSCPVVNRSPGPLVKVPTLAFCRPPRTLRPGTRLRRTKRTLLLELFRRR